MTSFKVKDEVRVAHVYPTKEEWGSVNPVDIPFNEGDIFTVNNIYVDPTGVQFVQLNTTLTPSYYPSSMFIERSKERMAVDYVGRQVRALVDRPDGGHVGKDEIGIITDYTNGFGIADFPSHKGYSLKHLYFDKYSLLSVPGNVGTPAISPITFGTSGGPIASGSATLGDLDISGAEIPPPPPPPPTFKKGDEVQISDTGGFPDQGRDANGNKIRGVVAESTGGSLMPLYVKWDNNPKIHAYNNKDLEPWQPVGFDMPAPDEFKEGDEVMMAEGSEYYALNTHLNPIKTRGIVRKIIHGIGEDDHPYKVEWSNGAANSYRGRDLVAWDPTCKFDVGDEVMISPSSKHYGTSESNPAGIKGVIDDVFPIDEDDEEGYCYNVQWSNGEDNHYTPNDLDPWDGFEVDDEVQAVKGTEWSKYGVHNGAKVKGIVYKVDFENHLETPYCVDFRGNRVWMTKEALELWEDDPTAPHYHLMENPVTPEECCEAPPSDSSSEDEESTTGAKISYLDVKQRPKF